MGGEEKKRLLWIFKGQRDCIFNKEGWKIFLCEPFSMDWIRAIFVSIFKAFFITYVQVIKKNKNKMVVIVVTKDFLMLNYYKPKK